MIEEILKDTESKMILAIEHLSNGLRKIRTGRAHASLVEDVLVSYYGTDTTLRELASINAPEANLIQIKPYDRNSCGDIEMAIRNAELGVNPTNDGNFIRITLPPMTEERRIEFAKQIKKMGEEAKIALRNLRGDAWGKIQGLIKRGDATEDDKYQSQEKLNKLIEKENAAIDKTVSEKEQEIMNI